MDTVLIVFNLVPKSKAISKVNYETFFLGLVIFILIVRYGCN